MQQQSSGTTSSGVTSFRQTGVSSVPASPSRTITIEQSSSTTTATNLNPSIGENGSLFTLTNIYTFGGGDGNSNSGPSDLSSDKYRVKSFVEVFDQPSSSHHDSDYERRYHETHSSSSFTRKVRTSATDTYDYGDNSNYDASRYQHHYEVAGPSTTKYTHGKLYFHIPFVLNTLVFNLYSIFQVNDLFVYLTFVYLLRALISIYLLFLCTNKNIKRNLIRNKNIFFFYI
jgi:hypothetical protein